jgi:hypothetical protein
MVICQIFGWTVDKKVDKLLRDVTNDLFCVLRKKMDVFFGKSIKNG